MSDRAADLLGLTPGEDGWYVAEQAEPAIHGPGPVVHEQMWSIRVNGRTMARLAATTAALGIGAAAAVGSTLAQPIPTPLDAAIDRLTAAAAPDPASRTAVTAVANAAELVAASGLDHIAGGFTPFLTQATTMGCGRDLPLTTTVVTGAAGIPGPDRGIAGPAGTIRFQASPMVTGFPISAGLALAWVNLADGRSGIAELDDLTDFGTPALSKTVDTGPGTVAAAVWGTIDYPGQRCALTPALGVITVDANPETNPYAPPTTTDPNAPAPAPISPGPATPPPTSTPAPAPAPAPAPDQNQPPAPDNTAPQTGSGATTN
ncbi:hypothetical protein [Nocardia aurantia]|uniref:Uncharacterized protein n=1 Tax=Nocardia aurantia TaxID=2585199 RepID=A0A7K0DV16_9NOCA|nr:hypothetical protein [Nocardia aurantia]MQY28664.1 hypothetical protein [Nocardia aurantia]